MSISREEEKLLKKLASGALDGGVGDERVYRSYRNVFCGMYILHGEPVSYRQWDPDPLSVQEEWNAHGHREEDVYDTDDLKLEFLQKYGWLIDDADVREYSAKFKK